ncbi:MAG: ribonuclease H-like domain-containing protein [Rubritalea sp.]|tara:strand:+ start:75 stop:632 length:558 start_codon:yes stop_codon:yes gene_type:complete
MKDIVYFDLETKKSFSAVGGSKHKDKMGMSVGVTYSTKTGEYHVYDEEHVDDLVKQLIAADLVVGYNHIQFDYSVLQAYTIYDLASQTLNLDMMLDLQEKLDFRLKLDSIATSSLGTGKTADGLDALRWWNQFQKTKDESFIMKIAEYCCYDVKVTKGVHEYGIEKGLIHYDDKGGERLEVAVSW